MRRLHALMVRAAAHQVWRMRAVLPDPSPHAVDDLANQAADEAMTVLLSQAAHVRGTHPVQHVGLQVRHPAGRNGSTPDPVAAPRGRAA